MGLAGLGSGRPELCDYGDHGRRRHRVRMTAIFGCSEFPRGTGSSEGERPHPSTMRGDRVVLGPADASGMFLCWGLVATMMMFDDEMDVCDGMPCDGIAGNGWHEMDVVKWVL